MAYKEAIYVFGGDNGWEINDLSFNELNAAFSNLKYLKLVQSPTAVWQLWPHFNLRCHDISFAYFKTSYRKLVPK